MPADHQINHDHIAARKNANLECGIILGQLNLVLNNGEQQFIAIPCTELKGHKVTPCRFMGVELMIMRRER